MEINPQRNALLETRHADFFGWPALSGRVHLIDADLRAWLLGRESPYDLIVFPLDESSVAAGAGVRGLLEDYLFTREAFSLYWSRLTARGALAVTRWVKLPPRDEFKLVNTVIDVLTASGVDDPAAHIALIRSWKTTTLLVARSTDRARDRGNGATLRRRPIVRRRPLSGHGRAGNRIGSTD